MNNQEKQKIYTFFTYILIGIQYNPVMTDGPDTMTIAKIEGLMAQMQVEIGNLSNTNPVQLDVKHWASKSLHAWQGAQFARLKAAYQEVETS